MPQDLSSLFGGKQPQAPKKQTGLFKKPAEAKPTVDVNLVSQLDDLSRRLRMIEERFENMRKKVQLIEQNALREAKKVNTEVKTTNSEVSDVRKDINDVKAKIMLVIKELQLCAKKEDVEVLNKYIEMWQPVNFVTQEEVVRIVKRVVEDMQ